MRIDFLGKYQDVQRLLDSPKRKPQTTASQSSDEFSLNNNSAAKQGVIQPQISHEPIIQPSQMMARYDFSRPIQKEPELQPLQEDNAVRDFGGTVKTPSIRSAKRIPLGSDFSETPIANRFEKFKEIVLRYGEQHGVDPTLGLAVVSAESSFNHMAVSSDGKASKGLFQLLDTTGREIKNRLERDGPYNPFDPELNSDLGIGYLKRLHELFSSSTRLKGNLETQPAANSTALEKLAIAAFNAGEGRVAAAQRSAFRDGKDPSRYEDVESYLPEITQKYVQRVLQYKNEFKDLNLG